MAFGAGERLGPYEIHGPIGAGGMGEVYQARDTRLGRDVAIKVSAGEFSARFEREARAIAALNHPNICTLYDVGPNYLVLELVPGPTLAEVIAAARTPDAEGLRLADVVAIARQIAEALEAAHEKGIVHRDLKPTNVKITPDGAVKVLDFGLAKALDHDRPAAVPDANSPTLLSPARTERGVILGTAAYMAPEQAKGRPVDKHADIWAFGVVLFEMLTGRKLFRGETATEIIAAVIKDDIALDRLPPDVPPVIRRLLARCLERDPRQRLRDIGEARIVLADPASIATSAMARPPETPGRSRASWLGWTALALVLAGAAGAAAWWLKPDVDLPLRRIDLADPLASSNGLALAPDGSRIAYFSDAHLYVRALDALAPQDLGAVHVTSGLPFWSPDGRTIGFFAAGAINTIPAGGGPMRQVCRIPATGRPLDFVWRPDGTVFFAVSRDGVYTVPAAGGTPAVYLAIDPKTEIEFTSVSLLPDNRLIVTTRIRDPSSFRTELVGSGPDRRRTTIVADPDVTFVKYDPFGLLLFRRRGPNNGIWAVPFDEARVDLARAVEIAPGGTSFQADATGAALIGLPPPAATAELVWLSETGEVSLVPGAPIEAGSAPVLSPDGSRAAVVVDTAGDRHLVVRDLKTGSDTRLTPAGQDAPTLDAPSWFPSGDEVVFGTGSVTARRIVARRIDGSGGHRVLIDGLVGQVTPNRQHLVFLVEEGGATRLRYAALAADGSVGAPERVLKQSDPNIVAFDLSPDGSTLAYSIPEADARLNSFLTDFPAGSRQLQVTTTGGARPQFSGDGKALFYLARAVPETDPPRGAVAKRPVALKSLDTSGPPVQLLVQGKEPPGILMTSFDVARDGRMLTMRRTGGDKRPSPRLILVQNWRAAVGR
ncbi:MAG TPA: protein kinase [Vicinamibacterales bacterium]|nr:protein kinase [Vicinamibacterales bacterium]